MTSLSVSKTASQLRVAAAACTLARHLYVAQCAILGIVAGDFDDLSPAQQRYFIDEAEPAVLKLSGYTHSKAEERAIRTVVTRHDVWDEFNEESARLIETMLAEVQDEYTTQLKAVWREQNR
jgi:hypothetical protein